MTTPQKLGRIFVIFCCLALAIGGWALNNKNKANGFEKQNITIVTHSKTYPLIVEIAKTPAQWELGLMHRTRLDGIDGMLFLFGENDRRYMWMKNTHLPLDMVFFDKEGTVVDIARDAVPESTDVISSLVPSAMILELPAGKVNEYGIQFGDKIHVPPAL